jgi:hypothetical protein
LRDEPRRLAIGRAGRRHVENEFSVERMSERAASLYTRTIRTGQRSRRAERAIATTDPEAAHVLAR